MIRHKALTIAFALAAALGPAIPAAGPQDQVRDAKTREVTVALKLIQAYVMNNRGVPVPDLTAGDFEVSDNGRVQKIVHFEKCELDAAPGGPAASAERPAPRLPRKFFLVFNYAFIDPAGIIKARKAALEFFDGCVQPSDEVGIVSFSITRGMAIEEFLTIDHARIRSLIENMGMKSYAGRADQIAALLRRNVDEYLDDAPVGSTPSAGDEEAREMVRQFLAAEMKARQTNYNLSAFSYIQSMRSLAQGLRIIPGYKHLVLFSFGISNASLFGAWTVSGPETLNSVDEIVKWGEALDAQGGDARLRETYEKMTEELKAANCPVYSFNVAGAQHATDATTAGATNQNALGMKASDTYGNDSLKVLSSGTGGQYFHNTMDSKDAVAQVRQATGTYYVLGFSIPDVMDGKFHKIKVDVKRKGCRVNAEAGYSNPKPYAQSSPLERYIQILDLAEGRASVFQEPITFSAQALSVPLKGKVGVSVFSRLPAEAFKSIAGPKAEIVTILFNERNKISYFRKNALFMASLGEGTVYHDLVEGLLPGRYDCRVVVRNLDTGRGASAGTAVLVPAVQASPGILLHPAHLFQPGTKPRYLGNVTTLGDLYPFPMAASAPVIDPLPAGTVKILAVVPCAMSGIADPELDLTGSLVRAGTDKRIPLEPSVTNSYGGQNIEILLVEIALPALEPGSYVLSLSAAEKKTGSKSGAETAFRVR